MLYTIAYAAGPYSGFRTVHAAIVRARVRKEMSLPLGVG